MIDKRLRDSWAYLLLPALKFLNEEVVPLGNLAKLGIHATLKVNEILPCLKSISGILIALSDNLVEMSHGNLGHEGFLDCPAKDRFNAGVPSL